MKSQLKNKSGLMKKTMNATTKFIQAVKSHNRKPSWKSKTTKMTKTLTSKTLAQKPNMMTEDDIQRLFKNNSKLKSSVLGPTKVSTQVGEVGGFFQNRDFVSSVKFLQVNDQVDKFLSGLPNGQLYQFFNNLNFCDIEEEDLTTKFKKNYLVGKIIGEGAYASVRVAIYKPNQQKIALKIYQKSKIKDNQRKKSVRREIKILQLLNHPNIVKIYDVVETNNHLNISMQYLPGLSLSTYLKAQPNGKIGQKTCKKIFKQIAQALSYMHQFNVAHRDIKLQNIILDQDLNPKLIDFGFSTCIQPNQKIKIFCGTPSYMAPQVVQRRQYRGQTADIWATGVLMFVSLTGIFPFRGATDEELFKKISSADFARSQLFQNKLALDLIDKMLSVNIQQRLTALQVLNHPWFQEGRNQSNKKRNADGSQQARKRTYTTNSNQQNDIKHRTNKIQKLKLNQDLNKTGKKFLAQTCKENLNQQLRLALKSPTNKQITSFRKKKQQKKCQKQNFKFSLKNEKNHNKDNKNGLVKQTFLKQSARQHEVMKKKDKLFKTQPKVIQMLRMQIKKRQNQISKSNSNTHRANRYTQAA